MPSVSRGHFTSQSWRKKTNVDPDGREKNTDLDRMGAPYALPHGQVGGGSDPDPARTGCPAIGEERDDVGTPATGAVLEVTGARYCQEGDR